MHIAVIYSAFEMYCQNAYERKSTTTTNKRKLTFVDPTLIFR